MKHLFVPLTIAKLLVEKGFNEPCIAFYDYKSELTIFEQHPETNITCYKNSEVRQEGNVLAPLNQQVIEWFAKEHKIYICIDSIREDYFLFALWSFTGKKNIHDEGESFENYNDCLTNAIKEASTFI